MSDDKQALREIAAVSDGDACHIILHYLYVSNSEIASQVTTELRLRGFRTEDRLGADGENWLVLARHDAVPTEELIETTRMMIEALMDEVGGEYDGWEVEMEDELPKLH